MISNTVFKYCSEDISKIDNYEIALNDNTQIWHVHHRLEEKGYSQQELKDLELYYGRPANELIFMRPSDHMRLHCTGRKHSEKSKKKLSETNKRNAEKRKKIMGIDKKTKPQKIRYFYNKSLIIRG